MPQKPHKKESTLFYKSEIKGVSLFVRIHNKCRSFAPAVLNATHIYFGDVRPPRRE